MAKNKSTNISINIESQSDKSKIRYYRKNVDLITLLSKIKLWPSRKGVLHGIKSIQDFGEYAIIETHCGETFKVRNSKTSRASRWLKNKWSFCACGKCRIPEWKIKKYSSTIMTKKWGSSLKD